MIEQTDKLEALAVSKAAHTAVLTDIIPKGHRCGPIAATEDQWDALIAADEAEKDARAKLMPTDEDALRLMFECYTRLKELGWREAIYCPKDGAEFDAIEAGSTGIHCTHYQGEWPSGSWWIAEAGDLWPARPILFRAHASDRRAKG